VPLYHKNQHLVDSYNRRIDYLRVSLTEACNFRCVYCVPEDGLPPSSPTQDHLTKDELVRFLSVASSLGIKHVRLTGGEPLLRADLVDIVVGLKTQAMVEDLSITTNGSFLLPRLESLKKAGLDRVNISLDSMEAGRFREVTGVNAYDKVFETVLAALQIGFPVKLNMVVLSGLRENEILKFVELAVHHPLEVRFLEFMPLCGKNWSPEKVMKMETVRQLVGKHYELESLPRLAGQVARSYRLVGGKGAVGYIGSLTESFCNDCSRLRLTADGKIKPCLFSDLEVNVRKILREGSSDQALAESILLAVSIKPAGNNFLDDPFDNDPSRSYEFSGNPLIRNIGG